MRDVAEVVVGTHFRTGAGVHNGEEAVVGTAMMLAGENSRLVATRVKARLAEIQPKLPAGMVIRPLYDRSDLVDRTIHTVGKNLFEGAILGWSSFCSRISRQLACGVHRGTGDSAVVSVRDDGHGAGENLRKSDESGGD